MTRLVATLALIFSITMAQGNIASSQGLTEGLGESNVPLEINADEGIEWRRDLKQYVASGNARAAQGELEVFGDQLIAHYREAVEGGTEIYRVDAVGNVKIVSPGETAYGDNGVYDIDKQVMVLTGQNLRMVSGADTITARDSLEYWETKQLAIARGNAIAIREDKRVHGNVLTAHFVRDAQNKLEIERIDAHGDVRVATKTEYATGDKGVYFVKQELANLIGNVKITQGENQMNGDEAQFNLATGVSKLVSKSGKPVQGLILPSSKKKKP
ncbi:LptA/OstA family protein [Kiloniella sp. EL199]|uniref:LptA/OstA family protein n=1 Tax=Kiloniella sp. EL199 TaxID=2107581 RepID=UPI000EA0BD29|nr:LptA/OstA family protein [Kiloniella sp. EL199]